MNKSEANAFETLAQYLAGDRAADDPSAIRAARFLATRAQAALRAGVAPKVEREAGRLGPEFLPAAREAYADAYPGERVPW